MSRGSQWASRPIIARGFASGAAETAQIDQHAGLQQFLGRHRQRAPRRIAAPEQRGDAVRHRPDVQRHHQRRRPLSPPAARAQQLLGRRAQHRESAVARLAQFGIARRAACRPRTSPNNRPAPCARRRDRPCPAARRPWTGPAVRRPRRAPAPSRTARSRAARHSAISSSRSRKWRYGAAGLTPAQRAASAKVKPAGPFCAISSSAARTSASLQIAVVIAARAPSRLPRPAHVNSFYIKPVHPSMRSGFG